MATEAPRAASPSATVRSDRRGDAPRGGRRDRRDGHGSWRSNCNTVIGAITFF